MKGLSVSIVPLFALFTVNVSGEVPRIPFNVSLAITVSMQNSNLTTNSTTITVPTFTKSAITTKSLLPVIAQDEFLEDKYSFTTFPAGARLVFLSDPFSFEDSSYVVEDKIGNILVDVSDLMTFEPENDVSLISYVQTIPAGTTKIFYKTFSWDYVGSVTFDDTGAGGTTQFTFSYVVNATMKDTLSKDKDLLTESVTSKLGAATGTAALNGVPAVLTAPALTLTGKTTFPFVTP